jgi:hypothetical protein
VHADNLIMMLRRFLVLGLFALVVGACTGGGSTETTASEVPGTTAADTNTSQADVTTSSAAAPQITTTDLSGLIGVSEAVKEQLADLMSEAQEIRGLSFIEPPNVVVVDDAELEARVRSAIEEEAEDFPADEALYKLLGLLGEEQDLRTLLVDLYGDQVAGFYDGETGEIVVPARDDGLSLIQQGTMIHELVHALTDQHFGFDAEFGDMLDEERLDEATAYQALIEGDATLAEVMWVQRLPREDLGRFVAESLQVDTGSLDAVPQFISDTLIFPYDSGLVFVQELYESGGWAAVNDAYLTMPDLPGSTEQVITPDDYRRDLPIAVELPSLTLAGYQLERTSVWGEEAFRTMLDQEFSEAASAEAADGWGGDAYNQWYDGSNAAFLLVFEGDTARDLEELRSLLLDFARSSVPEEAFVWVDEEDGLLYFIAADEVAVGELIRDTIGLT